MTEAEAEDRIPRLRKRAGLILHMSVRGVTAYPESGLDLYLVRPPEARPVPAGPDGELRLRVLTHGWRLDAPDRVLAAALDPPDQVGTALDALTGRTVTGLEIARPGLDTTIFFGDLRLRVFPVSSRPLPEGCPAWTLRTEEGVTLIVGPGTTWGMARPRPGTEPREPEAQR